LALAIVVASSVIAARADVCLPAKPSNQRGQYYSWRVIDGRTCWYAGRPGRSKSQLHWAVISTPDRPSVNPVEIVRATAVALPSNDLDGTFHREWSNTMNDFAILWWLNPAAVETWPVTLSGGH